MTLVRRRSSSSPSPSRRRTYGRRHLRENCLGTPPTPHASYRLRQQPLPLPPHSAPIPSFAPPCAPSWALFPALRTAPTTSTAFPRPSCSHALPRHPHTSNNSHLHSVVITCPSHTPTHPFSPPAAPPSPIPHLPPSPHALFAPLSHLPALPALRPGHPPHTPQRVAHTPPPTSGRGPAWGWPHARRSHGPQPCVPLGALPLGPEVGSPRSGAAPGAAADLEPGLPQWMPLLWTDTCAAPLLGGRAWRRQGKVTVRRLRLPGPCAEAPRRGRDGLAAGPGELRRHRAAQLGHHRVHCHPWQIPRR